MTELDVGASRINVKKIDAYATNLISCAILRYVVVKIVKIMKIVPVTEMRQFCQNGHRSPDELLFWYD